MQARNRWIALVFISMAISLVIIDGTIVNTIFPELIRELNLSSTEVQWVQESEEKESEERLEIGDWLEVKVV